MSRRRSHGRRRVPRAVVVFAGLAGHALVCAAVRESRADDAGASATRLGTVVARVGSPPVVRSIDVASLEAQLASMPAFQRLTFGATPAAVRSAFLDQVAVRDALLALAAESAKTDRQAATAFALDRARAEATVRAVGARVGPPSAVSMDDVRAYFDANRARYDQPQRYQLWRILCASRDEAETVLKAVQSDPTPKTFAQLARDHSQDKATYLRSGNLGFLTAEGVSSEPGLRVDPAIVRAAQGVRDGDLVRAPVAEGPSFAVVWRRGSTPAVHRTVDDVADSIRDALVKIRIKESTDKLLMELRAANVRDPAPELLDSLELPAEPERDR